jgi:hypothetical protein
VEIIATLSEFYENFTVLQAENAVSIDGEIQEQLISLVDDHRGHLVEAKIL